MPLLAFAAASLLAVPALDVGQVQQAQAAFPRQARRERKSGAAFLRFWFDAQGRIYRCEVVETFGEPMFGEQACTPYNGAQAHGAKAPDGSPAFGMLTMLTLYAHYRDPLERVASPLDIELTGAPGALPGSSLNITVAVKVEADGTVSHCEGLRGVIQSYAEAACQQARRTRQMLGVDSAGNPVAYVAVLRAKLETPAATG